MVSTSLLTLIVWLYVTRSVGTTIVPDVSGKNVEEVKSFLADRDLRYRIHRKSSLQTPEDVIIRQIPPRGTRIKENRAIDLYVSKGPEYVVVPDLTGKNLLEARNFLMRQTGEDSDRENFGLGNISRVYSEQQSAGHVILQQPKKGQEVVQGSEIDVLISKGHWPRRVIVPEVTGDSLTAARQRLSERNLEPGNIRHSYRADSPPSVVLEQFPPPGRYIKRGQSISLTVNLSEPETTRNTINYTTIRIHPPLEITTKNMRVVMKDQRGKRVVYDRDVEPGHKVEFLASFKGKAELIIYWDEELYRHRTLDVST